jgi:hypothetical protein
MNKQDQHSDDIDDLDAFLKEDASHNVQKLDEAVLVPRPLSKLPRTTDPLQRLDRRVTHVFRSINSVLNNMDVVKHNLENDKQFSADFSQDINCWENVLDKVDTALPELATGASVDGNPEDPDDDIVAAMAAHIDTYVQEAQAQYADESGEIDLREFDLSSFTEAADEEDEHSISATDDTGEPDDHVHCDMDDTDSTTNREQQALLKTLKENEERIQQLQTELDSLKTARAEGDTPADNDALERDENGCYVNRLFVVAGSDQNLKYPLNQQIMTIGREAPNDIHIRSKYISRFHARIVSDQDGTVIEDLDSRNGITVNSRKVRRKQLKSGDLIDIGRVQFKYIDLMEGSSGEGSA